MTMLSIVCAWAVIAADPTAIAPPTYRLEVGQRIEAEVVCQGLESPEATEKPDPEARVVYRWTFWVIDQNDKLGSRIVVRHVEVAPTSGITGVEMASFWLSPTGVVSWDESRPEWPAHIGPEELWPRLPDAKELLAGVWEQEDVCNAVRWTYSAPALDGALVRFRGARQSALQSVAGGQSEFIFTFDPHEGRLSSVQSDERYLSYKEFYANHGKLEPGSSLSAEELRQFREDWNRTLSALSTYRLAHGGAGIRATRLEGAPTLPAAIESLRVAVDQIKSPEIREWAERKLASATKSTEERTQTLAERAARLDQSAPDWSAKDLAGKEHSLSQYRGQVVLLDFWFRQCSYCIRLVPQLDRVEQTFQGKPFVLLSMNTDENEEDARIAAERLGLAGPVLLHTDEIASGLGVDGFPTLVLIDQEGKVRDILVGHSTSREAELEAAISRLLSP
jgi:thiol-disulfide isomerase/thioredoxin